MHLYFAECPATCRKSFACTYFGLSGISHPREGKFGPIALLWLPKRGYSRVPLADVKKWYVLITNVNFLKVKNSAGP